MSFQRFYCILFIGVLTFSACGTGKGAHQSTMERSTQELSDVNAHQRPSTMAKEIGRQQKRQQKRYDKQMRKQWKKRHGREKMPDKPKKS